MTTVMPVDENNHPIPAVRLRPGGGQSINVSTLESARNAVAFDADTKLVSLYATVAVYVRFGGPAVSASSSDHYYPAGIYYDFSLGGGQVPHYTHVAVIAESSNGTVYISEKE